MELTPEQNTVFGEKYGSRIAEVIHEALLDAGLTLDEVDLVIPHNVNKLAWRQTIKELEVAPDKVFLDNVPRFSHTFASDVFVNYTTLRDAGRLVDGAHYLLVSVGLGATFGAMVITHRAAG